LKVAWKDLSRGLEAVVLPATTQADGRAFTLVPNQTVYSLDCSRGEEAFAMSAILNSTVVDALCLDVAERAKDDHFRYLAATVAATPVPVVAPRSVVERMLSRLAARSHGGERLDREIDEAVASLYGISASELSLLERFAVRRRGERRE
jgi:chemotaxis methyl-accepting protein methylase